MRNSRLRFISARRRKEEEEEEEEEEESAPEEEGHVIVASLQPTALHSSVTAPLSRHDEAREGG
eukprot:778644-Rhodomonas_salina.1